MENDFALVRVPELPVGSGERQCSGQNHTFPDLLSFRILLPSRPFSWEPSPPYITFTKFLAQALFLRESSLQKNSKTFTISKLESYGLLNIVKMKDRHERLQLEKKNKIQNKTQNFSFSLDGLTGTWLCSHTGRLTTDSKGWWILKRSETYSLSLMFVLPFSLGELWQDSVEIEPKKRTALLSWGGTDQSLKLPRWLWSRVHEERLLSRGRHKRSGAGGAGVYLQACGQRLACACTEQKTQQDLTKTGCCRARNSSEMQQVTQCQKMLAFQSRQGGENCWWPQAFSETP